MVAIKLVVIIGLGWKADRMVLVSGETIVVSYVTLSMKLSMMFLLS